MLILMASSVERSASHFFSRYSLRIEALLPIALAFHSENAPDGSVWKSLGCPSWKPVKKQETPNGLTPPFWVYYCWTAETLLAM